MGGCDRWVDADRRLTRVFVPSQLHGSSGVGGASLDNDVFSLCDTSNEVPAPLTPSIALTVAAVRLFGVLFPHIISAQR